MDTMTKTKSITHRVRGGERGREQSYYMYEKYTEEILLRTCIIAKIAAKNDRPYIYLSI